jgi:outer membrane protein TolC
MVLIFYSFNNSSFLRLKLTQAIAQTNFAKQRDQIRFDIEQYCSQLQSNLENVQTATVALNQASEALPLARLRF